MEEELTITKAELRRLLTNWERDSRAGRCMPLEAAAKLSAEEIGELSANNLWNDLKQLRELDR